LYEQATPFGFAMVRTRSQGSAELNEVRETIGLRPAGPADDPTPDMALLEASVPYPDVIRRGGYPAEWLGGRIRQYAGLLAAVSSGVAASHEVLAGAFASAHGTGPWGAAAALLAWPVPLLQPVLAGVGAVVLCAVGVLTAGWRRLGRRQRWLLAGAAVAAALGAGPMVLVCALIAVACVLAVVAGLAILFCLISLLSR